MKPNRRDMLCTAAALGAAWIAPGIARAQGAVSRPGRPQSDSLPEFVMTRDGFTRHLNYVFRVYRPGRGAYGIGLVAVIDGAAAAAAGTIGSQHCFTAVFVGPAGDALPEGTYDVASPEWAAMQLFLKRSLVQNGYQYYEVPFNALPTDNWNV